MNMEIFGMLEFMAVIVPAVCGVMTAYLTAKSKNKSGFITFISMCWGGAVLAFLALVCLYFSIWLAGAYALGCIALVANAAKKFSKSLQTSF